MKPATPRRRSGAATPRAPRNASKPSRAVMANPAPVPPLAAPLVEIEAADRRRPRVSTDHRSVQERIEERAFLLWLDRGGDAMQNWLDAEREILAGS